MSKNLKIALIVCGCLVLLCSGVVGIGVYWYLSSGRQMVERMSQGVRQSAGEGATFGLDKPDNACLKEALSRIQKDDSLLNTMSANLFLASCLGKSKQTPEFCQGVPGRGEFTRTSQWAAQRCKELGIVTQACGQLMGVVQAHCNARTDSPNEEVK